MVPAGPTLGFVSAGSTRAEPGGTISIPVQLSVPGEASVSVAVTGGTAVKGFDYQLLTSALTFTAANPVQQVQVLLQDDADPELAIPVDDRAPGVSTGDVEGADEVERRAEVEVCLVRRPREGR